MCLDFDLSGMQQTTQISFIIVINLDKLKQAGFLEKIEVVSNLPKETEISDGK